MNFDIPERIRDLLPRLRDFVDGEVAAAEAEIFARGFAASEPVLAALRAVAVAEGFWGPQLPAELGGLGLSLVEHGLVSEVLGRSPFGHYVCGCQAPDAGNIEILHRHGTAEQKQRYLAPLVAGDIRSCFSMTEPEHAGSNPTQMSTTARRDGDDYVLSGHKWFTTAAEGARFAIVMAVTAPDAGKHDRASMLIVPTDTAGYELVRNIPIAGDPGSGWASHGEVRYRDCRVPRENLLGAEGGGFRIAQERLGPGRIHHCMRWIGICERAFAMMCRRAASRDLGEGRTLASKQIVQAWIAESRAAIDAARLAVLHAAWTIDAVGFQAAREQVSLIKFSVAEVMLKVVDRAMQVHGALGLTSDTVLAHYYVHERGARIYDGPDEVHKMVVARRILERVAKEGKA